jgi:hypothetical protein
MKPIPEQEWKKDGEAARVVASSRRPACLWLTLLETARSA